MGKEFLVYAVARQFVPMPKAREQQVKKKRAFANRQTLAAPAGSYVVRSELPT